MEIREQSLSVWKIDGGFADFWYSDAVVVPAVFTCDRRVRTAAAVEIQGKKKI